MGLLCPASPSYVGPVPQECVFFDDPARNGRGGARSGRRWLGERRPTRKGTGTSGVVLSVVLSVDRGKLRQNRVCIPADRGVRQKFVSWMPYLTLAVVRLISVRSEV